MSGSADHPISHHEALIYVMVMLSAVDRAMSDRELKMMGDIVKGLPVFADFRPERLLEVAQDCTARLQADNGLRAVLRLIGDTLPPHLYVTAYALAVEVAAADMAVGREEIRFLQMLRDQLGLDKLTVAALELGASARYRRL